MRHRASAWVPIVCLPLLCWSVVGCGGDDPPTDVFELSGFVLDDRSGGGVSGARVVFTSDTLYTEDTTTDEDGLYEMLVESDVPFGQVRVTADGYQGRDVTVFFDMDIRRLDVRLTPAL